MVAIAVFDIVELTLIVNGRVVAIGVLDRVIVTDCVRDNEVVIDFVKGCVVGMPVLDNVCVTD